MLVELFELLVEISWTIIWWNYNSFDELGSSDYRVEQVHTYPCQSSRFPVSTWPLLLPVSRIEMLIKALCIFSANRNNITVGKTRKVIVEVILGNKKEKSYNPEIIINHHPSLQYENIIFDEVCFPPYFHSFFS